MKIIEFSKQYQDAIIDYCVARGVPRGVAYDRFQWVDESEIARTEVRYTSFILNTHYVTIKIPVMCSKLGIPLSVLDLPESNCLVLDEKYQEVVIEYCKLHDIDYQDLSRKIQYAEGVGIPQIDEIPRTTINVLSTSECRRWANVYVPKLLKYLQNPMSSVWMVVEHDLRIALIHELTEQRIDLETFLRHVEWTETGEYEFELVSKARRVKLINGTYKYLDFRKLRSTVMDQLEIL